MNQHASTASTELLAAFPPLDRHFANFLVRLAGRPDPQLALAAAFVSRSRGEGHVCLDLHRTADPNFVTALLGNAIAEPLPEPAAWREHLAVSGVVGQPGEFKPLILDAQGRLYLQRLWAAENELGQAVLERARELAPGVDEPLLEPGLARAFPAHSTSSPDAQAVAAQTAVRRRFTVIAGGPGTGKTRTVTILLALILEQSGGARCRIALAAPTGKAAARLQDSIQQSKGSLACAEEIKERLPTEAFTVHRLLGVAPDSGRCRFNAANPLPFEVVVVDEASMVDLIMMNRLFAALPREARLILLGDPDQLASVEPGAVLGDLCLSTGRAGPLPSCVVRLHKNYRFEPNSGLLNFSRNVQAGEIEPALGTLAERHPGLSAQPLPPAPRLKQALREWTLEAFRELRSAADPDAALRAFGRARILTPLRQGPYGVQHLNELVEEILSEANWIDPRHRWYAGRPILITKNDYQLGLFNGDVGLLYSDGSNGETRAFFLTGDGALRTFAPVRLPAHESVWAMTVHKSQGSEFDRVLFLLPDQPTSVVTRELIYTGVTRASRALDFWFSEPVLRAAFARRADRPSGLREALWGEIGAAS